jgi:hypothetical protein
MGKLRPHNRHQNQRAEIFSRCLATSHARCGESMLSGLLESEIMSQERLAVLIQAHQKGLHAPPEARSPYEAILSILAGLNNGTINMGQALRHLCYQTLRLVDDPAYQALYRQAAADLRVIQREAGRRSGWQRWQPGQGVAARGTPLRRLIPVERTAVHQPGPRLSRCPGGHPEPPWKHVYWDRCLGAARPCSPPFLPIRE